MLKGIERRILQINRAAGVEVIIMPDDSFHINFAIAETKKNNITKSNSASGIEQIHDLSKHIAKKIPLSLVFNGKAILIKKGVSIKGNSSLSSVLPNANPDYFYFEKYDGHKITVYGIARKEIVNKVIKEFTDLGYKVIAVSLGFSTVENILPFLNNEKTKELETDCTVIEIADTNEIADFKNKETINNNKYESKEYLIANQYVKPATLLAFSAAVGLLADDIKSDESINKQILSAERKEYRYYKLFKTGIISLLIIFFSILLINFFIYNHYFNKNKSFESSQHFLTQQSQKINSLENKIKKKEKFLQQTGWMGNSRTSFFADRIASLTPEEILLTSMQIYTSRNNLSSESANNFFKQDTILVTGTCVNPVELNTFVNNLKILSDFKNVTVKGYQYRNEKESGSFSMEIITN